MTDLQFVTKQIDDMAPKAVELSRKIWEYAELPNEEFQSAALQTRRSGNKASKLRKAWRACPRHFSASFAVGTGKPVIGLLGEYDALDALSQKAACPQRAPIREGAPGHGCDIIFWVPAALPLLWAVKEYLVKNTQGRQGHLFWLPCGRGRRLQAVHGQSRCVQQCGLVTPGIRRPERGFRQRQCGHHGRGFYIQRHCLPRRRLTAFGTQCPRRGRAHERGTNYLRKHMIDKARIHYAYSDAAAYPPTWSRALRR